MALILGLCFFCVFAEAAPPQYVTNSQDVQSICGVMKDPKLFQDKPITLQATAHILYGGSLLKSDECKVPDVTVHYEQDFEKRSNTEALELLQRIERAARENYLRGTNLKAERTMVSVVLEGRLEKNPFYHMQIDRGAATVAAWDYHYEYAFVVARVVSLRRQ
jgi:hypothetical protein